MRTSRSPFPFRCRSFCIAAVCFSLICNGASVSAQAKGGDTISSIRGTHHAPVKAAHDLHPPAAHARSRHISIAHHAVHAEVRRHIVLRPAQHYEIRHVSRVAARRVHVENAKSLKPLVTVEQIFSLPNIVGWWIADNNTVKGVYNTGTVQGGVTFVPGIPGLFTQAFKFDGTGSIAIPDQSSLAVTKSFSISAWVNVASLPSASEWPGAILWRGDDRPFLDPYWLTVTPDGFYRFQITDASNNMVSVQSPVQLHQWVWLTATLNDQADLMSLYVNGKLASHIITIIRPFGALDSTQHPSLSIGEIPKDPNIPGGAHFQGMIADVVLYNGALTQEQIATYYHRCMSYLSHLP